MRTTWTCIAPKKRFGYLITHCEASAKNGSIVSLRRKSWGNACIVRCNGYLFKVSYPVFSRIIEETIP